ncbi:hypothetical protein [Pseudomonas sp. PS02290]|uniref:hypothetical protein n=1 Tax=Pseudomonas sp. PS02290 TaxID=2991430 RepID=UPI00249A3CFD|nr:hypothetical protein [Pseudomonas sp. PS02290]
MKGNQGTHSADAKIERRRLEWAIILQCMLAAFVVPLTFYIAGKFGPVWGFNFFSAAIGILLVAVSLLAKKEWLIRGIAIAGMVITTASVFVNPPWSASSTEAIEAVPLKALAYEYLIKKFTLVDEPVIIGDTATISVWVMNQKCALTMSRAKSSSGKSNESWLVTDQACAATN